METARSLLFGLTLAFGVATSAAGAVAGSIVSPVRGVVNEGGTADPTFSPLDNTFNQSGLGTNTFSSGVTNFDLYIAGTPAPLHSHVFSNEWFSAEETSIATVTFDLGKVLSIDRLALWNEDAAGIGLLDLYFSLGGDTFSQLATGLRPTNNLISVDYLPEVFSFNATNAQFIRFEMSNCPQDVSDPQFLSCSIGEVAFRVTPRNLQPVPEPVTLALVGISLAGLGAMRRRRQ